MARITLGALIVIDVHGKSNTSFFCLFFFCLFLFVFKYEDSEKVRFQRG